MRSKALATESKRTSKISAQWHDRERRKAAALAETPVVDATGTPIRIADLVTYWSEAYRVQSTGRVTEMSPGWKFSWIDDPVERVPHQDNLTVRAYAINESNLIGIPGAAAQWIHGCKASAATIISDPLQIAQWELAQAKLILEGIDAEEVALGVRRRRAERELAAAKERARVFRRVR